MSRSEGARTRLQRAWASLRSWTADADRQEWLVGSGLTILLLLSMVSRAGFPWDRGDWINWAIQIQEHGLAHVYDSGANYHPLWLYVLGFYAYLCGSPQAIGDYIPFLKLFALVFDLLIVVAVAGMLAHTGVPRRRSLLLLVNPAFVYITILWGQVDSVLVAFLMLALWAAVRQAPVWGCICLALSLAAKLQAVILIPPLALMLLWPLRRRPRRAALAIGAAGLTLLAILAPFILAGTLTHVWQVVRGAVGFHAVVSKSAFGFWTLLLPGIDLGVIPDSRGVGGVSFRTLGLLLFGFHYALAGGAWLRVWRGGGDNGLDRGQLARVALALGLLVMAFFLFPTEIHERYLYPAVALFGLAAALGGHLGAYLALSAGFLLNVEQVLEVTIFSRFVQGIPFYLVAMLLVVVFWRNLWSLWRWQPPSASPLEIRLSRLGQWLCVASGALLAVGAAWGLVAAARAGVHLTFTKPSVPISLNYIKLTEIPIRAQEYTMAPAKTDAGWNGDELRTANLRFEFGFGVHASNALTFDLPLGVDSFQVVVGLAQSAEDCAVADVLFRVTDQRGWVLASSGLCKPGSRPQVLRARLQGVTSITLQTLEGRNGPDCDHGVWGEPIFLMRTGDQW